MDEKLISEPIRPMTHVPASLDAKPFNAKSSEHPRFNDTLQATTQLALPRSTRIRRPTGKSDEQPMSSAVGLENDSERENGNENENEGNAGIQIAAVTTDSIQGVVPLYWISILNFSDQLRCTPKVVSKTMRDFSECTQITPACPLEATTYGYYPNFAASIIFTVFFGLCALFQLGFGAYYKTWTFMIALAVGALLEMAGYIGRILLHDNPWATGPFKLQIVTLILGPTLVAAAIYLTLKHIVLFLGSEYSRIAARLYTWIFISCDVCSLVLQAIGGGVAAAAGRSDKAKLDIGNRVIITGIAFQVVTMSACGLLGLDFFIRASRNGAFAARARLSEKESHWKAFKAFCFAEILAYTTVLIRCIYR
ncbi:hypothetical protein PRK78_006956 [Emydomyces testavorans]|uniref:Uncharacterized protein n=1 Tax=Emydomyces testavorans TaxID=2070801 RepID=A0AAF0IM72_9EURO|nr:hypothetical protein PRK78_006956 [Emydomyces testavorans]